MDSGIKREISSALFENSLYPDGTELEFIRIPNYGDNNYVHGSAPNSSFKVSSALNSDLKNQLCNDTLKHVFVKVNTVYVIIH